MARSLRHPAQELGCHRVGHRQLLARSRRFRDSLADLSAVTEHLGYEPSFDIDTGLEKAIDWYKTNLKPAHTR